MTNTDNMKVEFTLIVNNKINVDNIINKPIITNDIPVGIITEAKIDESGLYYNCNGIIWGKFIGFGYSSKDNEIFEIEAINIIE